MANVLSLVPLENTNKMATDNYPIFANSSGKIFADRIVFASSNKESGYALNTINKVTFKKRIKKGSIAFSFLPGILLFVPYFSGNDDTFIKALFIGVGLVGLAVSLAMAKVSYIMKIEMASGRKKAITVWEGNKKDAQKFTEKVNTLILKYKEAAAQNSGYATELTIVKPIPVK